MTSPGCQHKSADGRDCKAFALKGTDRCIAHSNDGRRRIAADKMRSSKRVKNHPESFADILSQHEWNLRSLAFLAKIIMRDVYDGKMEPSVAHALSAMGNMAIRAMEKGDLETRIENLEKLTSKAAN